MKEIAKLISVVVDESFLRKHLLDIQSPNYLQKYFLQLLRKSIYCSLTTRRCAYHRKYADAFIRISSNKRTKILIDLGISFKCTNCLDYYWCILAIILQACKRCMGKSVLYYIMDFTQSVLIKYIQNNVMSQEMKKKIISIVSYF